MRRFSAQFLVAALFPTFCLLPLSIATGQGKRTTPIGRFAIQGEVVFTVVSPAGGLTNQFRSAGYAGHKPTGPCTPNLFDPRQIYCDAAIEFPKEKTPGTGTAFSARYRLRDRLAFGVGHTSLQLGGSSGHPEDSTFSYTRIISSNWNGSATWGSAFWIPMAGVRLGGGPGIFRFVNDARQRISKLGLVLEAGNEFGANRRVFIDLAVRAGLVPRGSVVTDTLPLRPRLTHVSIVLGLGLHF